MNGSDNSVVWNQWELMAAEAVANLYQDNPSLFQDVSCLHLAFSGINKEEFDPVYGGTVSWGEHFIDPNTGNTIYQGPVSIQRGIGPVLHERMHIIGTLSGLDSIFTGFPDRGDDCGLFNSNNSAYPHYNLYKNDLMEHSNAYPEGQRALYGLVPLTSHDLMFLGWILPSEILEINKDNYSTFDILKLKDINYPLTAAQISDGYKRLIKVRIKNDYSGNLEEYFLIEYHLGLDLNNQPTLDRVLSNYDEYPNCGNGILIWHIREITNNFNVFNDIMMELKIAKPYNTLSSPARDLYWNGIFSGENNYYDDNWRNVNPDKSRAFKYLPDGGRHLWEITTTDPQHPDPHAWWPYPPPDQNNLLWPRLENLRSNFFTDETIDGQVRNKMSDNTIPSTKKWGNLANNLITWTEFPGKTHISIMNITRHFDNYPNGAYMSLKVKYNYWEGEISENETMSGNVIIGADVIVPSGKTLTIQEGAHIKFENSSNLIIHGTLLYQDFPVNENITFEPAVANNRWGSIIFDGAASNSVLKNAVITNSSGIECLNGANVHIQECTLTNPGSGIYIYNSQPTISNNTINDPQQNGIYGEAS